MCGFACDMCSIELKILCLLHFHSEHRCLKLLILTDSGKNKSRILQLCRKLFCEMILLCKYRKNIFYIWCVCFFYLSHLSFDTSTKFHWIEVDIITLMWLVVYLIRFLLLCLLCFHCPNEYAKFVIVSLVSSSTSSWIWPMHKIYIIHPTTSIALR